MFVCVHVPVVDIRLLWFPTVLFINQNIWKIGSLNSMRSIICEHHLYSQHQQFMLTSIRTHNPVIASEMMVHWPNTVHTTSIKTLFCRDTNYYNKIGGLFCFKFNLLDCGIITRPKTIWRHYDWIKEWWYYSIVRR